MKSNISDLKIKKPKTLKNLDFLKWVSTTLIDRQTR